MTSTTEQSLLSAIPNDVFNIIKEFNLETREVLDLKILVDEEYSIVSVYKEGYKITKYVNEKKVRKRVNHWDTDKIDRHIKKLQIKMDKHYPVYVDNIDTLIHYIYTDYYSEYSDDSDDESEPPYTILKIGGMKSIISEIEDFSRKIKLFINLIVKVYKKK